MRQFTALMLIVLLSVGSHTALAAEEKRLTLQERVAQIPGGAIVKIKLKSKETVQGRLGEVTSDGYTVQIATGATLVARKITYDETKSIKHVGQSKTGLWVTIGVLGGIVGTIGVLAAIFFAHES